MVKASVRLLTDDSSSLKTGLGQQCSRFLYLALLNLGMKKVLDELKLRFIVLRGCIRPLELEREWGLRPQPGVPPLYPVLLTITTAIIHPTFQQRLSPLVVQKTPDSIGIKGFSQNGDSCCQGANERECHTFRRFESTLFLGFTISLT